MRAAGPVSTISPRYITATVSARSAASPRSWVMSRTLVPSSSVMASTVSRMRRCTVTSSAEVGSSATSSRGRQASPMAMRARCRIPPENSCGYCAARAVGSGMPTSSRSSTARAQAAFPVATSCTSSASATWSPIRISGSRLDIGSCGTSPIPAPRIRRMSRSPRREQISPVELDAAAGDASVRRQQPVDGGRGRRLPGTRLADQRHGRSGRHGQGNVLHRGPVAVRGAEHHGEVTDLQDRCCRRHAAASSDRDSRISFSPNASSTRVAPSGVQPCRP